MKNIINLIIFSIFSIAVSAQVEVAKLIKPSSGECNGIIVLKFIDSEIPVQLF